MRNKKGFSLTEAIVVVAIIVMVTVTAFATINKNPDNNEFEGKSALQKMSDIVDNYYMVVLIDAYLDIKRLLFANYVVFYSILNQHLQCSRNDVFMMIDFVDIYFNNEPIAESFFQ